MVQLRPKLRPKSLTAHGRCASTGDARRQAEGWLKFRVHPANSLCESSQIASAIGHYLSRLTETSSRSRHREHPRGVDPTGTVTLRLTDLDLQRVHTFVDTLVVAAIDTTSSADPRLNRRDPLILDGCRG